MTPMQILKNNFSTLRQKLDKFEEINLNKSRPKDIWIQHADDEYVLYRPEEETNFTHITHKGVKSDFIKLFKAKTKTDKYSIAFHFHYLDTDTPTIECSLKQGEHFHITEPLSINEMKAKINQLNAQLESNDVSDTVSILKDMFFAPVKTHTFKR